LFCGAGGSSCGARLAGASIVAGIDKWPLAIETYRLNHPDAEVYESDLKDLSPRTVACKVGRIQLLLASPECTNHSIARGGADPDEKSQNTAFQVIRFAEVLKPRWVIVENVVKMRQWRRYEEWLKKLKSLGYENPVEVVLDAQHYGVAQSRKRLFIVCDREGTPEAPPRQPGPKRTVKSILTSRDEDGKHWPFAPLKGPNRAAATLERAQRAMKSLGKDAAFLMVYYGTDGAGGWQALDRPLRTITTLDRFALVKPNGRGHEMRMLQPTELAAAMGFPEYYLWPKTARRNRIKMIGNAVCPPVMQAIVSHLLKNR
jgi:DNA (cytosine-5)-methyltransferase 1